ncbi:transposase [Paenibacillus sp. SI8]|uniref:transposase n=1 Tax=unclassified Paenibacillus TaxID=185978 RepID=UPI003467B545
MSYSNNPKNKHISRFELDAFHKQHVQAHPSNIKSVTGFYSTKRTRPLTAFAAQASKWINETFHGIGSKYLQLYLDEFCFRLNLSLQNASVFDNLSRVCFLSGSLSQSSLPSREVA